MLNEDWIYERFTTHYSQWAPFTAISHRLPPCVSKTGPLSDGDSESSSSSERQREKRGTLAQIETGKWRREKEEEREGRLESLHLTCGDIKAVEVERKAEESSLTSTCQSLTRHHDTIITGTLDSASAPPSPCSRQTEPYMYTHANPLLFTILYKCYSAEGYGVVQHVQQISNGGYAGSNLVIIKGKPSNFESGQMQNIQV